MNSAQRRRHRRALDRMLPPGTRVRRRYGDDGTVYAIRARANIFERDEYNRVLVEKVDRPFGYSSVSPRNIVLADQGSDTK